MAIEHRHIPRRGAWICLLCSMFFAGCATGTRRSGTRHGAEESSRDPQAACALNEKGLKCLEDNDLDCAETRFRESLQNDLYYAPAHNNLGLILLKRGEHYEAALELDFARRLMPDAAEPRNNLGVLYDELGRSKRACEEFQAALAINPDNLTAMRHLARVYVKSHKDDEKLTALLEKILLTPDGSAWDVWARGQLIRLGRSDR